MTRDGTPPIPNDLSRSAFAPETVVETDEGPLPMEWLAPGLLVKTQASGLVPVRSVEASPLPVLSANGAAVELPPDAIEDGVPGGPVTVAPGHLLLVRHPAVEFYFAEPAVFVEASDLVGINGIAWARARTDTVFLHPVLAEAAIVETLGLETAALGPDGAVAPYPVLHSGEALVLREALEREWQAVRQSA